MTIRDLEVRLARDIDDKLHEKFGYRDYAVNIPGYGLVEPRPEIKAVDTTKISDAAKQLFSRGIGGRGIPNEIYTCKPPRSISEAIIRGSQYWTITRDESPLKPVKCRVLGIVQQDSRWLVYLGVSKTITL